MTYYTTISFKKNYFNLHDQHADFTSKNYSTEISHMNQIYLLRNKSSLSKLSDWKSNNIIIIHHPHSHVWHAKSFWFYQCIKNYALLGRMADKERNLRNGYSHILIISAVLKIQYSKEKVEDVHTNVEKRQGHYVSAALFIITCQGISIHYLRWFAKKIIIKLFGQTLTG